MSPDLAMESATSLSLLRNIRTASMNESQLDQALTLRQQQYEGNNICLVAEGMTKLTVPAAQRLQLAGAVSVEYRWHSLASHENSFGGSINR